MVVVVGMAPAITIMQMVGEVVAALLKLAV
jgi:hypothetical protein